MIPDHIIETFPQRSREEVLGIIKDELIREIVTKTLHRDLCTIRERHARLEKETEENFSRESMNFVYWMQVDPRRIYPPQPKGWKKASEIIPLLPYTMYDFHTLQGTEIALFYPLKNGDREQGMKLDADTASRLAGILENERLFNTTVFLRHENRLCRVMWIQEDGTCSINTELRSYRVGRLEEILK